jgi:alanine racemase
MSRATVATIHLGALRRNLARVRTLAGTRKVMAVVKADGYGHGAVAVARATVCACARQASPAASSCSADRTRSPILPNCAGCASTP